MCVSKPGFESRYLGVASKAARESACAFRGLGLLTVLGLAVGDSKPNRLIPRAVGALNAIGIGAVWGGSRVPFGVSSLGLTGAWLA